MSVPAHEGRRPVDLMSGPRAPEAVAELASAGPVADDVNGMVWIFPHADVERLASDRRLAGVGLGFFDLMDITDGPLRRWYGSLMFTNEGAVHDRLRRLVIRAFKPRAVETLRASTRALVDEELTTVRRDGGGDLVHAFRFVPMRVMCRLLGIPQEDVPIFAEWTDALSPVFGFMSPEQVAAATKGLEALLVYMEELVERRRRSPGDDLVSALIEAEEDGSRLDRRELIDMASNLLVAGHDTTASQTGCSLFELLHHPEVVTELYQRPDMVSPVLDETMRLQPAIGFLPRTVAEPVEVAGRTLEPGTMLGLGISSANRDPAVWERPAVFLPDRFARPKAPRLLSFGTGPHYCLGANLARMTLTETLRGVAERPVRSTVDPAAVEWRLILGRSPVSLPVEPC
jgi:cytochrome P450